MVLAPITHHNDPKMGGIRGYFRDFLMEDFVRVGVLEYRSAGLLNNYLINRYLAILGIRVLYAYSLLSPIDNQSRSISTYYSSTAYYIILVNIIITKLISKIDP